MSTWTDLKKLVDGKLSNEDLVELCNVWRLRDSEEREATEEEDEYWQTLDSYNDPAVKRLVIPRQGKRHLVVTRRVAKVCDCGAKKARTTHSHWCKTNETSD